MPETLLHAMGEKIGDIGAAEQVTPEMMAAVPIPEGYTRGPAPKKKSALSNCDLLEILKIDIKNDISSESRPLSALNYLWVTNVMLVCPSFTSYMISFFSTLALAVL